ncbi:MAG TPA: MarR family transcriptional regulator [Solirubrobacteraceae bacterium]|nr:MarR family transcriptional regulator [Solirubrobacteraceae bacterium]
MSRELPPERLQLYAELGDEVRANQRATDAVDELLAEALGINRTDARCMDILDQHGRMSAGDLAQESRLTTGAITAVIDRLERAGIARRVPDPSDRRRVLVEPTEKAREFANELMVEPMREMYIPMAERYSDDDLRLILDFTRQGRELQERHADWLRERLKAQSERTSAP